MPVSLFVAQADHGGLPGARTLRLECNDSCVLPVGLKV